MTDALVAVMDARRRPPRQGDTDDGHGLLLDEPGYDRGARQFVIEDRLDTVGAHDCRLAFQLGPEVACALEAARAILEWRSGQGRRSATLPDGVSWRHLEGRTDPPAGWYSPASGVRVPSATLLGTGRVDHGQALVTVLQLDRGSRS